MALQFDISDDELPVFLAESEEQFQLLDEGLMELERSGENEELVQRLFRAAHTLKGSAGMIGHKRMVAVTHAMETALDGLRKGKYGVSNELIDPCFNAVDGLRILFNEIVTGEESEINIQDILTGFVIFGVETERSSAQINELTSKQSADVLVSGVPSKKSGSKTRYEITVHISKKSIASAARAFQVVLAMQEIGEIIELIPEMSVIETARPVEVLIAIISSKENEEVVRDKVNFVDELDTIQIVNMDKPKVDAAAPKVLKNQQ
jgi:two-component system chemotaxis sensor kinase CheA